MNGLLTKRMRSLAQSAQLQEQLTGVEEARQMTQQELIALKRALTR